MKIPYQQKKEMLGKEIKFVRYGLLPFSGFSHNWSSGDSEKGVSVYEVSETPRSEFEERDDVITGTAIAVDTGSDDEFIIDAKTITLDNDRYADHLSDVLLVHAEYGF